MLRRLATIATVLTLAACSDGYNLPTGVAGQQNIDDGTTVPPDFCVDSLVDESTLIPTCVDYLPWPVDDALDNRARHGYEAVRSRAGARKGARLF